MRLLPGWLTSGYLRLINPVADWLVRHDVQPNTITTIGTLCPVADGFVLGGLAVFFATRPGPMSVPMVIVCILVLIGTFVTSYTRARAEALGIDAKVGLLQRPERVVLLSVPQAFFGLALHGLVLITIITVLAVTAWITAAQRIHVV